MTIIIAGTLRFDPDKTDEAMSAVVEMMEATHREEGCHAYVFSADPIEEGLLHIFEKWESEEDLAAHFETAHIAQFRSKVPDLGVTGIDVLKYEVASEGPLG